MPAQELILKLYHIQAIRFGDFTLKSGIQSPIYIDLRLIISYPQLLKEIGKAMWDQIKECQFDLFCGVPYTAIPIATCLSLSHEIPLIMRRKEAKNYGLQKTLEGAFQPGQTCLIVEDLITSGSSILKTAEHLKQEGLLVKEAVVLIDREQGGKKNLAQQGYAVRSVLTLSELLDVLFRNGFIAESVVAKVQDFLASAVTGKKY